MAFVGKAEFNRNLFNAALAAGYSFFNELCAVLINVIAVTDLKVAFKIIAEVVGRDIKISSNMFHLAFWRIVYVFVNIGYQRFFGRDSVIYALIKL